MNFQIKARLNAALPEDKIEKWHNASIFAIDPALVNDPKFAAEKKLIQHAPEDIKVLLDQVERATALLKVLVDNIEDWDEPRFHIVCPKCKSESAFPDSIWHLDSCPVLAARKFIKEMNFDPAA